MSNAPNKELPMLVELEANTLQPAQQWILESDDMIIGREEGSSDIVIPQRQISRQHIRIFKDSNIYYLEDLNSKNGTWLNGNQIKGKRPLKDGDEINLALVTNLRFVGSSETLPYAFELPEQIGGRLRLDRDARRVFIGEEEIDPPLSPPQYRLLELMYVNVGSICTRDAVVDTVWPEARGEGVSEQAIDALVRRLRDRIAEIDPEHQYIVTVRGHGFRLDNPN